MTTTETQLTWSRTQVAAWSECQRKYFLNSNPEFLTYKKLKNRHMWMGHIFHEVVGDVLKRVRQGEDLEPVDELIETTRNRMRDEFLESKMNPNTESRLFEHHYKLQLDSGTWKGKWQSTEAALRAFCESPWLKRLQKLSPECWKVVDEVASFDVDGIKTYVKMDCVIEVNGQIILIDWKSSNYRPTDDLALHIAALYAHEVWDKDPEAVQAFVVTFPGGRQTQVPIDESVLIESVLRIQEDTAHIQEAVPEPGTDPLEISPTKEKSHCFQCNYQGLCYPKGVANAI